MDNKQLTFIDLFAGAGGLSEGFIRSGFTPIAHIEMNRDACNTLKTRAAFHYLKSEGKLSVYESYLKDKKEKTNGNELWSKVPQSITEKVICATIGEKTIGDIFSNVDKLKGSKSVDVIIGGPPCQAYSVAGRARMGKNVEKDPRNELYKYYVRFLERYNPRMFVFENVLGILTAKRGEPFADLKRLVEELGYKMDCKVQIASEHGVLQDRHRVIIVGWKDDEFKGYSYPMLEKENMPYAVMKDLFADLPIRKAGAAHMMSMASIPGRKASSTRLLPTWCKDSHGEHRASTSA